MTTKLDGELRRELLIAGVPYKLTLSPVSLTLALKGHRKGLEIIWADLVNGDAALATALNASLKANIVPKQVTTAKKRTLRLATVLRSRTGRMPPVKKQRDDND